MSEFHIGKENVGKIAERIVANELESCGFIVRDLNLEGISANADLLAIKDQHVWQVQVKGSTYDETYPNNGWWFQYGYCKEEHITDSSAKMFNRAKGPFRADVVALVCVRSPFEYQYVMLPIDLAEKAAQINLSYGVRTKKQNNETKKPGKVLFDFFSVNAKTEIRQEGIKREQDLLRHFLIDRRRVEEPEKRTQLKAYISDVLTKVFVSRGDEALTTSRRG
jgi:hypothetical protein